MVREMPTNKEEEGEKERQRNVEDEEDNYQGGWRREGIKEYGGWRETRNLRL